MGCRLPESTEIEITALTLTTRPRQLSTALTARYTTQGNTRGTVCVFGNAECSPTHPTQFTSWSFWGISVAIPASVGWNATVVEEMDGLLPHLLRKPSQEGRSSSFECQSRLWPEVTRTNTYFYLQNISEGSMCHCGSKQKVLPHPKAGEDSQRNLCRTNLLPRCFIKTLSKDCTE